MIDEVQTISEIKQLADTIDNEVSKYVVGWEDVLQSLTVGLMTGGHVLLEGVPGTAKTYLAKIFSDSLSLSFKRIQSTPDLMPADITGSHIFNPKSQEFEFRPGPIFANVVLMDEINRAPPKTQSALLEVMQERQVTVDGRTSKLDEPFMIIATKNPIEFAGTYPLPPAQLDRFMSRLIMNYPRQDAWVEVLRRKNEKGEAVSVEPVVNTSALLSCRKIISDQVKVSDDVIDYIVDLTAGTRKIQNIILGASPTASVSLLNAARGYAVVSSGRDYVVKDDVQAVAFDVLNHRLLIKEAGISDTDDEQGDFGLGKIKDILTQSIGSGKK